MLKELRKEYMNNDKKMKESELKASEFKKFETSISITLDNLRFRLKI